MSARSRKSRTWIPWSLRLSFILLIVIAGFSVNEGQKLLRERSGEAWGSTPGAAAGPDTVVVKSDGRGHYHVRGSARDTPAVFIVDTGASYVSIRRDIIEAMGLDPSGVGRTCGQTANGVVCAPLLTLERLDVEGIVVGKVMITVHDPEKYPGNLLGMSFLGRLSRVEIQPQTGMLLLEK